MNNINFCLVISLKFFLYMYHIKEIRLVHLYDNIHITIRSAPPSDKRAENAYRSNSKFFFKCRFSFFENFKHLIQAQILPVHIPPSSFPDEYTNDMLYHSHNNQNFNPMKLSTFFVFSFIKKLSYR